MNTKTEQRLIRKARVRKKISGTPGRPRLTVFKSLKNITAQVIDDTNSRTLAYVSTLDKEFKASMKPGKNMEAASKIGEMIAERALAKGIDKLVFDKNGYPYHGKVALIVEKVREKGIAV
ncbi:MAG: 50S ribosomal protein L18 [Nitrospinota bacterium]|nr:50S ribosomal protein L18 [Nitrospinota bacterium]